MSKIKGPKSNFRVVVTPRRLGDLGSIRTSDRFFYGDDDERIAREYQERCEDIAREIKRHVDYVQYCEIVYDQDEVCSHCNSVWTEGDSPHNGGCCHEDDLVLERSSA